jgi:protein arginine kinase activator
LGQGSGPTGPDKNAGKPAHETLNPKCVVCGQDLMQFRTSGRLGCPLDYQVFGESMRHFFESSQAASLHVGKWPKRGPSGFERLKWQAEMREAITRQDFEEAARLRDRLRERNKTTETK